MRSIIERYETRSDKRMAKALRIANARIAVAEAEHAREDGNYPLAASAHLKAMSFAPEWRTCRSMASDLIGGARAIMKRAIGTQ